jgi:hypothetical protein
MTTITVPCDCNLCLMLNVFGFAKGCEESCNYCTDGVFDKERWDEDTNENERTTLVAHEGRRC